MAFRKENKIKSNFSKISIGLASPEEILENSSGDLSVTVCSASVSSARSKTTNAIAVNINASVIKVLSVTVVV